MSTTTHQGAAGAETMTAGLSWLQLSREQKPIKSFPNRAGQTDTDDAIAFELEDAGIEVHRLELLRKTSGEVKTSVRGELHGWSFTRAWRYWIAEGPGIELAAADALYAAHPETVRIDGHCGCPSPREWFNGLAVGHYHVDSPAGLKGLADTIKALVDRPAAPAPRTDGGMTAGEPQGAWMQTFCLPHFRVLDPDPSQILIEDIAHHLSQNVRYGGAGIRFLSVAEHSVHMARAAKPEHALWALLHDASETYLHDLVRPVKRSLAGYAEAEDRIMRAVCERFGLPQEMPREVKRLDNRILIDETRQNMRPSDVVWSFGGETEPLGVTLQYWTPEQAEREFLATFAAITGLPVTMPAPSIRPDAREAIARIIAPAMWARFDRYDGLGDADVPEGNNISWMVSDSLSTADAVLAALSDTSATPAQPAGAVPDGLRALSEAATPGPWRWDRTSINAHIHQEGGLHWLASCVIGAGEWHEADQSRGVRDAAFIVAAVNHVRTLISTHPAGQSAGSGAENQREETEAEIDARIERLGDRENMRLIDRISDLIGLPHNVELTLDHVREALSQAAARRPAPDSTRTGDEGTDKLVRLLAAVSDRLRDNPPNGLVEGDLYVAAKNEGPDSGWRYVPTGLTVGDLDEARAMIAARPAAPEAQGAWLPIETAPKDLTILLGGWIKGEWTVTVYCIESENWREDFDWIEDEPTHWCSLDRLPAPPSSSGQGGR